MDFTHLMTWFIRIATWALVFGILTGVIVEAIRQHRLRTRVARMRARRRGTLKAEATCRRLGLPLPPRPRAKARTLVAPAAFTATGRRSSNPGLLRADTGLTPTS